jgi:hypothetical protein
MDHLSPTKVTGSSIFNQPPPQITIDESNNNKESSLSLLTISATTGGILGYSAGLLLPSVGVISCCIIGLLSVSSITSLGLSYYNGYKSVN